MTLEDMEEAIFHVITNKPGVRGVELNLDVMARLMPSMYKSDEYFRVLESLVNKGLIVQLEYTVPIMQQLYESGTKSIYFPKGTRLTIKVI